MKDITQALRKSSPSLLSTLLSMPCDNLNHYYVCGAYGQHTITCMSWMACAHLANGMAVYAHPYATTNALIQQVDQVSGNWTCCSMLFFELLFSYVSFAISFYIVLLNLFSITHSLICQLPEALKTKDSKKMIHFNSRKGLKTILQPKKSLKSLRPTVRKLDLLNLCFSLNFLFSIFLLQFPSMFPLLSGVQPMTHWH